MKIETLKDLKALVKLCRSVGIDKIEVDGVKFELGTAPAPKRIYAPEEPAAPEAPLTDEDVLFWSANG